MKYFLPLHYDSGNRGCQGITEGTAKILKISKEDIISFTTNYTLDHALGLADFVTLHPSKPVSFLNKIIRKIKMIQTQNLYDKRYISDYYEFLPIWEQMRESDVMLSTGGDMMCYSDNEINTTVDYAKKHNYKAILWGCSMGPENLTPEKENALHKFDLVYARESLSYAFFKSIGITNLVCLPDPAFVLKPEPIQLPDFFCDSPVVGLNISYYILGGFTLDSSFGKQIKKTIDYILNETKYQILLIPHVTWIKQDDIRVANFIKSLYANENRINVLDISVLRYTQIRYIISRCRYFIGGRTHAVISAYSTCVPTIALGYSIKSKGIAKDLGLNNILVVDSKTKNENSLLNSFIYAIEHEEEIRRTLADIIPEYSRKPFEINNILSSILS